MTSSTHKKGFTLIETFVAITILAISIVGPLTIASKGLQTTVLSRDQLTATYLAQEALEQVRYIKDSNVISGNGWLTGLAACINADCYLDVWDTADDADVSDNGDGQWENNPLAYGCSGDCPVLRYNTTRHRYEYGSGALSPFTRTVRITNVSSNEKLISVQVEWRFGSTIKSVEITERIFDWAGGMVVDQT